ncbi:MAG: hypothetical protein AAF764_01590 [Pseudomonadota bacterium]
MTASAPPRQSSFFAPREPRMDHDDGPFTLGWTETEAPIQRAEAKPAKLVMPNTELTAAKPSTTKRAAAASKASHAKALEPSGPVQTGLFDEIDRMYTPAVAAPENTPVRAELSIADLPAVPTTRTANTGSTGLTVVAFAAIAVIAGGLGFLTSSEPELITGSVATVGAHLSAPTAEQAAFVLPQVESVSLPVSAALGVGENFVIKSLLVCLGLVLAISAGFWGLRRLLSPKASRLHFDGRDQRIDASLVPPTAVAR